ncbi:MAG: hypothetical protein JXB35_09435 [Anaerolineae bacterium]|nr:hypothetical protein [Anaerolineae bacterium]
MEAQTANFKRLRQAFLVLLILSALVLGVVLVIIGAGDEFSGDSPSPEPETSTEQAALIASLVTSFVSCAGFISTTILAWRKELREARSAELDRRRRELEIERAQRDLAAREPSGE